MLDLRIIKAALALLLLLTPVMLKAETDNRWFVSAFGGAESHKVDNKVREGDVELLFDPKDNGSVLGLNLGYRISPRWFLTLDYSHADADDTVVDNLYGSANVRFPVGSGKAAFYLGVLGGYSELEWQEAPVDVPAEKPTSEQWFIGGQAGFEYQFNPRFSGTIRYQYHGTEHGSTVTSTTGRSRIVHDRYQYLLLGLRLHW